MELLQIYLKERFNISADDWTFFSSKLEKRSFKRKELIVRRGAVENYLSFIEKGSVRLFVPMEENDLTFGFVIESDSRAALP